MSAEVIQAVRLLSSPGQVVEVRAIAEDGMASGYFDDPEKLTAAVEKLDCLPGMQGIYVTLNEMDPALLSRRANRVKVRLGKKDATTADADILRRRWFPVDVDPVRPSGVSSTDAEHQAAIEKAERVAAYLVGMGWPAPVVADSGNGAHLLSRIDLPNNDETRDLVKHGLEVLAAMFDDRVSTIDTANHNAARIWKLYGTLSRKGDHTRDRPHRRACLLTIPDQIVVVSRDLLDHLTRALPGVAPDTKNGSSATPRGRRDGKILDLGQWLNNHGIGIRSEKPYLGGTLFVLDECPWSGGHKDGAFAIQFPSGAIYAGCHHASCGGGGQRWRELRERFEPTEDWPKTPPPPGSPAPAIEDLPGKDQALTVLKSGDPIRAMLRTFALDHEGDEPVAECLFMSLASRSVLNTNGLHVSVTGESGKGKSHAFSTVLQQVPVRFRLDGAMSNKALFYMDDLLPGMAIVLDDTSLSEDMAEILKGVTTSFRKPFIYRTVNKDRRGQVCTIPERCIWWVAKVEGSGDDQVFNRMLTVWIDDTEEQDTRVLNRILSRDVGVPEHTGEPEDVRVCRAMWEILSQQRIYVIIPFSQRIRFQASENRRNPEMLLDLIKANAMIRFMQRDRQQVNGTTCITATHEDFTDAARIYSLLNGTTGGQTTKLTKRESDLLAIIERSKWCEFTIPTLQKATGWSNSSLHRIIHGYASRGAIYSGLLEKCPAIAYTDRTVVTEEESGISMRRRTNAYTFDPDIYRHWCEGGTVWIEEDREKDETGPSALQQPDSSLLQSGEGQDPGEEVANGSGSPSINNKNICIDRYSCNSQIIECKKSADTHTSVPICDPRSDEGQDHSGPNQAQNAHSNDERSGFPPGADLKGVERPHKPATPARHEHIRVKASDYKVLDLPEGKPLCYACGRRGVQYVEKWSPDREKRKREQSRRICKRCYDKAVYHDRAAAPPLPGVINLTGIERCSTDLGRCSVCNLGTSAYFDRATSTKLCEQCYAREARQLGGLEDQV